MQVVEQIGVAMQLVFKKRCLAYPLHLAILLAH